MLTGAVLLGYINAFSTLIGGGLTGVGWIFQLPIAVALGLGALGTANNKKIGILALTVAGGIRFLSQLAAMGFAQGIDQTNSRITLSLTLLNSMVFSVALLAAVLHKTTLEYRKIWFE